MRKTCFDSIYELAKKDDRVVYIGSDVGAGTLDGMKKQFPDRFFMEGIQEQNIIGMATGLALSGKIVYVNTIASFITRRCYEQVYLDVGLHNAKVRLLGNGGGLVYAALGATHIACDDIALMRNIPNMTIVAPCDADEMKRLMPQTLDYPHPMYIRFAAGNDPICSINQFEIGKANLMRFGEKALIISTGITTQIAMTVPDVTVLHCHTIKPLDRDSILFHSQDKKVIVVEEHSTIGGLGDAVRDLGINVKKIGVPDVYVNRYGTQAGLLRYYGIIREAIQNVI